MYIHVNLIIIYLFLAGVKEIWSEVNVRILILGVPVCVEDPTPSEIS